MTFEKAIRLSDPLPAPRLSSDSVPAHGRWLAIWLGVAVLNLLKHAGLFLSDLEQPWPDSVGYWQLGQDVAAGDPWLFRTAWGHRTPGYPWLIGLMQAIAGPMALTGLILVQHLASLLTDAVVVRWTYRITRSRGLALAAAGLCLLATARPLYANWILTETLATFVLALAGLGLWNATTLRRMACVSILSAIGILIRPSLIVLAPAVLLLGMIEFRKSRLSSTGIRLLTVCLPPLIFLAILGPWCARNARLFDRWTLVTFTGRELWTANFSPWPGTGLPIPDDAAGAELRGRLDENRAIDLRHNASVSQALARTGMNDADIDRLMERVAWQAIRRDPLRSAVHVVARMGTFWYCKEYPAPPPLRETTFSTLPQPRWPQWKAATNAVLAWAPERTFAFTWGWSLLTALSIPILLVSSDTRRAGLLLGWLLASTTLLTAVLEIPLYRYRLPLEPLTIVAVVSAVGVVRKGWNKPMRNLGRPISP